MVTRLIAFMAWRLGGGYGTYLTCLLTIGPVWMIAGRDQAPSAATALAVSMGCAFLVGPALAFIKSDVPEFIYLPLSRRQLWRSRVAAALIVPVAAILAIEFIALAVGRSWKMDSPLGLRTVLLSAAYNAAYAGAGIGFFTLCRLGALRQSASKERTLGSWRWGVPVLVFGTGPVLPLLLRTTLATEWAELNATAWILIAAGLLAAATTLFHSPGLARPGRRHWSTSGSQTAEAMPTARTSPIGGIVRLIWPEVAITIAVFIVVAVMLMAIGVYTGNPFDSVIYAMLLVTMIAWPTGGMLGVRAALRPLRALPISPWTLSSILTAQPVLIWLVVWALQSAARMFLGDTVPLLTSGGLCWFAGIASLASVAGLAWMNSRASHLRGVLMLTIGASTVLAAEHLSLPFPVEPLGPFVAAGGVAATFWLSVRMLSRNNSLYRGRTAMLPS